MIKIIGNDIKRDGEKLGWIDGNDVRDMSNRKLGYVVGDDIHRGSDGFKTAFVDGAFIIIGSSGKKISIVENRSRHVTGGSISDAMRAAIRLFFGD
mgnify:CR=1 FL=1